MKNLLNGFLFHSIGVFIIEYYDNNIIGVILAVIGLFTIFKKLLLSKKRIPLNKFQYFLFVLLLLQYLVIIIRGYLIDYQFLWFTTQGLIKHHFFDQLYILPYFIPLLILIPFKSFELKYLFKIGFILNIFFLLIIVVNIPNLIYEKYMMINNIRFENSRLFTQLISFFGGISIFVLLKKYIPNKLFVLSTVSFFIIFFISLYFARRGAVISCSLILITFLIFNKWENKFLKFGVILFSAYLIILNFNSILNFKFLDFLILRSFEDNRSIIDSTMLNQMNNFEIIFGKGLNGRYYLPLFQDDYLNGWRYVCETGFYNLILKGGYFLAITYILFFLLPSLKGIFKSNNNICKIIGAYILLSLIELYPFGLSYFNFKFFFIWIGAVVCSNKKILKMNDTQVLYLLKNST